HLTLPAMQATMAERRFFGPAVARRQPSITAARNFSRPSCVNHFGAVVNDDAQLIDEALAGQSVSFGRLVTKYQDRLYNALVHVIGSTEEARDVVQDAFVQAFLKLGSFHRSSAFYTWLYRIAFNVAISRR